ncbi:MAG: hypothetical protein Q8M98_08565 [Candidatus Cloacimonadaceae bacterium]|nr:hypothetical protein [Candidatus Cloacimonadaceae bacterium]
MIFIALPVVGHAGVFPLTLEDTEVLELGKVGISYTNGVTFNHTSLVKSNADPLWELAAHMLPRTILGIGGRLQLKAGLGFGSEASISGMVSKIPKEPEGYHTEAKSGIGYDVKLSLKKSFDFSEDFGFAVAPTYSIYKDGYWKGNTYSGAFYFYADEYLYIGATAWSIEVPMIFSQRMRPAAGKPGYHIAFRPAYTALTRLARYRNDYSDPDIHWRGQLADADIYRLAVVGGIRNSPGVICTMLEAGVELIYYDGNIIPMPLVGMRLCIYPK